MSKPDAITYVPLRVYDAARRLEAACKRIGYPSEISVAEYRSENRPTLAARVLWHQVWRLMMEEECVFPDYNIVFVVVDDPAFRMHLLHYAGSAVLKLSDFPSATHQDAFSIEIEK